MQAQFSHDAEKTLNNLKGANRKYAKLIKEQITYCLELHLFKIISGCSKKKLKCTKDEIYRMHVERQFIVFYKIIGDSPDKYAYIIQIDRFGHAHHKYRYL